MRNCIFFNASIETSKVERELEFNQSSWLKPYIELTTTNQKKQEKGAVKTKKAMYKLINSAVYG